MRNLYAIWFQHRPVGHIADRRGDIVDSALGPRGADPLHPPHGLSAGPRAQSAAAALPRHHARLDACTGRSGPHLSAADCR